MESNIRVSGTICRNCCSDPHGIKLPQLGVVAEKEIHSEWYITGAIAGGGLQFG